MKIVKGSSFATWTRKLQGKGGNSKHKQFLAGQAKKLEKAEEGKRRKDDKVRKKSQRSLALSPERSVGEHTIDRAGGSGEEDVEERVADHAENERAVTSDEVNEMQEDQRDDVPQADKEDTGEQQMTQEEVKDDPPVSSEELGREPSTAVLEEQAEKQMEDGDYDDPSDEDIVSFSYLFSEEESERGVIVSPMNSFSGKGDNTSERSVSKSLSNVSKQPLNQSTSSLASPNHQSMMSKSASSLNLREQGILSKSTSSVNLRQQGMMSKSTSSLNLEQREEGDHQQPEALQFETMSSTPNGNSEKTNQGPGNTLGGNDAALVLKAGDPSSSSEAESTTESSEDSAIAEEIESEAASVVSLLARAAGVRGGERRENDQDKELSDPQLQDPTAEVLRGASATGGDDDESVSTTDLEELPDLKSSPDDDYNDTPIEGKSETSAEHQELATQAQQEPELVEKKVDENIASSDAESLDEAEQGEARANKTSVVAVSSADNDEQERNSSPRETCDDQYVRVLVPGNTPKEADEGHFNESLPDHQSSMEQNVGDEPHLPEDGFSKDIGGSDHETREAVPLLDSASSVFEDQDLDGDDKTQSSARRFLSNWPSLRRSKKPEKTNANEEMATTKSSGRNGRDKNKEEAGALTLKKITMKNRMLQEKKALGRVKRKSKKLRNSLIGVGEIISSSAGLENSNSALSPSSVDSSQRLYEPTSPRAQEHVPQKQRPLSNAANAADIKMSDMIWWSSERQCVEIIAIKSDEFAKAWDEDQDNAGRETRSQQARKKGKEKAAARMSGNGLDHDRGSVGESSKHGRRRTRRSERPKSRSRSRSKAANSRKSNSRSKGSKSTEKSRTDSTDPRRREQRQDAPKRTRSRSRRALASSSSDLSDDINEQCACNEEVLEDGKMLCGEGEPDEAGCRDLSYHLRDMARELIRKGPTAVVEWLA